MTRVRVGPGAMPFAASASGLSLLISGGGMVERRA